jgi:large subunit ribosomal protein L25
VISHVMNEVDVTCLPKDLPEFIEVDLSNIAAGESIHLSNVKLPQGVALVAHGDDLTVATASIPAGSKSEAAEGEAPAE